MKAAVLPIHPWPKPMAVRAHSETLPHLCRRKIAPSNPCRRQSGPMAPAHSSWFSRPLSCRRSRLQSLRSFAFLFNSLRCPGPRHPRPRRGFDRPSLEDVYTYRPVDAAMLGLRRPELQDAIILGLNHEQRHQELILTDIKHAFSQSPVACLPQRAARPAARKSGSGAVSRRVALIAMMAPKDQSFADNETPRHRFCSGPSSPPVPSATASSGLHRRRRIATPNSGCRTAGPRCRKKMTPLG
jgi:hypothetical protein